MAEFLPSGELLRAIGLVGLACALGWAFGMALGEPLYKAKEWIIKRWGGRLAAYLILKARNLRKKNVALLKEQRVFAAKRDKALVRVVAVPDAADAGKQHGCRNPVPNVHNVIPFRKVRP